MLKSLYIKNIALIDEVRVSFEEGFNVFTGETGAGKSIVIDAIMLLTGEKADKNIIKEGEGFAKVEGFFEINDSNVKIVDVFNELGIEMDTTISLSRMLHVNGKSEYRLNGELCTLNVFKKVSHELLDIFGQNDNQKLLQTKEHIKFIDEFAGKSVSELKIVLKGYIDELNLLNKEISALCSDVDQRQREIDLLNFEINQIEEAGLVDGEEDTLFARKKVLLNSEKIHNNLTECCDIMNNNCGLSQIVKSVLSLLGSISGFDEDVDSCRERLSSIRWELEDVISVLEEKDKSMFFDENELSKVEERLTLINDLKRKFGDSVSSILMYLAQAKERVQLLNNSDEELARLDNQKNLLISKIYDICENLHHIRVDKSAELESLVIHELKELGMKNAKFEVKNEFCDDIDRVEKELTSEGLDKIEFMFSANLGQAPRSLSSVVSGGELSRFSLAFKTIINLDDNNKTLIFDEIDAGIGGNTGSVIGKKITKISTINQVICITHLAQIAAFADTHFRIIKTESNNKTITAISCLQKNEKQQEVSRMIGCINNTSFADMHSKELLSEANSYKLSLG